MFSLPVLHHVAEARETNHVSVKSKRLVHAVATNIDMRKGTRMKVRQLYKEPYLTFLLSFVLSIRRMVWRQGLLRSLTRRALTDFFKPTGA